MFFFLKNSTWKHHNWNWTFIYTRYIQILDRQQNSSAIANFGLWSLKFLTSSKRYVSPPNSLI